MRPYLEERTSDKAQVSKTKREFLVNKDLIVKCAEAKSKAKDKNYMDAYNIMDELKKRVQTKGFSKEDKAYVDSILKEILKNQYRSEIIRRYELLKAQYRAQNDRGVYLELEVDKYPRETYQTDAEYFESYISMKAIEQISEDTKNDRYGGIMHVIIGEIMKEYRVIEKEKAKVEAKLRLIRPKFDSHEDR